MFTKIEGFSYIETLLSLSIISMIAFIMPGAFSVFSQMELVDANMEGDIFVMDIIAVSGTAEEVITNGRDTITFETARGHEEYRYRNSRVIKSINGEGFITMMFDVVEWKINDKEEVVSLKVKTNGEFDETLIIKK
ncbi:Competence protein ComGF [Lacicoccus alkaliphilus]|uniref:Competence protein ComGF n=3 Tax=Lacicoccus TaxID=3076172 RepID=A0A1M7BH66_9BACL|nr:Competence protein ComGF [Salinicoccus alkaliphilus DSM 16010]